MDKTNTFRHPIKNPLFPVICVKSGFRSFVSSARVHERGRGFGRTEIESADQTGGRGCQLEEGAHGGVACVLVVKASFGKAENSYITSIDLH
jgi:hypothetical protein